MLSAGQVIQSRYRILNKIAEGGQSLVYLASDQAVFDRLVVVKVFKVHAVSAQDLPAALKQFTDAARLLAPLDHPGIARINDWFVVANVPFIVTDYVTGGTLEDQLQSNPAGVPEAQVAQWANQLCDALTYLHTQQPPIIFRDLKPDNIMLSPTGQLKMIDFGIARTFKQGQSFDTEAFGAVGYAAPEQYGKGQTGPWSDVYALGVTLLRLATGFDPSVNPFQLPRADALKPAISAVFAQAVERATQLDPQARFASAEDFRRALQAASPTPTQLVKRVHSTQRTPWLAGSGMALLLVLCAGLALFARSSLEGTATVVATAPMPATFDNIGTTATPMPTPNVTLAPTETSAPTPAPLPTKTYTPALSPIERMLNSSTQGLVAYESGDEGTKQIFVADPATGEVQLLPGQKVNSKVPSWSSDGQRVAFRSNQNGAWQIYSIRLDGTDLKQLTHIGDNYEGAWSPDGTLMVFVSKRDGNKEIYVMNADDSDQRRLTFNTTWDDDPTWSPDGQWIVFESERDGWGEIYKMHPDGSEATRLTNSIGGAGSYTPAWSPDGDHIAFERESNKSYQVWVMNADGSNLRQITFDGTDNGRAAWSPDSTEIAYTSNQDGQYGIWIVPIDRSKLPRRLSPDNGFNAAWSRR